jgi:diketogulonate reductase-like aldo/keto reductase
MSYSANSGKTMRADHEKCKVDPEILRIAKQAYRDYVDLYSHHLPRPMGMVVNRNDGRGKPVYNQLILLPQEVFVPIEYLD